MKIIFPKMYEFTCPIENVYSKNVGGSTAAYGHAHSI